MPWYDEAEAPRQIREVEWDAYPSQDRFANSTSKFVGMSGPVGTGKSKALVMRAIRMAYLNPGLPGCITAPTYTLLRDTTRLEFLEVCTEHGIPYYFQKADNDIYLLEPNSQVRFRSTDDPLRLVGSSLAWFGMDELTYTKKNAWERMLARLRHPRAACLSGFATWTPKGHDWVYADWVGPKKVLHRETVFAKPGENSAVLKNNPTYYESMKDSYEDAFYRQEALGEYVGTGGSKPYSGFDQALDVEPLNFDPRYPIIWSLDFNVNPMSSLIAQKIPGNPDRLHILQELYLKQANTRMALEEFIKRTRHYVARRMPLEVEIMGDSTGRARDTTGELQSDWDIVFQGFRQYPEYRPLKRVEQNPPERSRIVAVNSAFKNAAGMRRISISDSCPELAKDMEQCTWAEDSHGNQLNHIDSSDKMRGHLGDALGYLVWGALRIMQSVGPASGR